MTPQDVKKYFGSGYKFTKQTGMSGSTLMNWHNWGYVPFVSQKRLEKLTDGKLKAVFDEKQMRGT